MNCKSLFLHYIIPKIHDFRYYPLLQELSSYKIICEINAIICASNFTDFFSMKINGNVCLSQGISILRLMSIKNETKSVHKFISIQMHTENFSRRKGSKQFSPQPNID